MSISFLSGLVPLVSWPRFLSALQHSPDASMLQDLPLLPERERYAERRSHVSGSPAAGLVIVSGASV